MAIIYRTVIITIALLIITRILGKRQMTQLTFFDYIVGISIGSIAGDFISQENMPIGEGVLSLTCLCLMTILNSYMSIRSRKYRKLVNGELNILIEDGKINKKQLKSERINLNILIKLLRGANVFSVSDVKYAILETDGKLSVLKKPDKEYITISDMKIKPSPIRNLPCEVIGDGEVLIENLQKLNLSEEWLNRELKRQNINSPKKVFYAEVTSDGELFISALKNKS